jgi:hypothetical protein
VRGGATFELDEDGGFVASSRKDSKNTHFFASFLAHDAAARDDEDRRLHMGFGDIEGHIEGEFEHSRTRACSSELDICFASDAQRTAGATVSPSFPS